MPLLVVGWSYGLVAGLAAGVLAPAFNTALLNAVGLPGWDVVIREGGGPGTVMAVMLAGMVGYMHDLRQRASAELVERQHAETTARQHGETLQTIFDTMPLALAIYDQQGRITAINEELESLLGWNLEEWQTRNLLPECYPDPAQREAVLDFMTQAPPEWRDFQTRTKDGRILSTSWFNIPLSEGGNIGLGQDITQRKLVQEAVRAKEAEAAALAEIGRIISSTLDIGEVYERVASHVQQLIAFDRMTVTRIGPAEDELAVVYTAGTPETGHAIGTAVEISPEIGEVAQQRRGKVISVTAEDRPRAWAQGFRTLLVVPLIAHNDVIGLLTLRSTRLNGYDHDDLSLAERVGAQIAGAIANAQVHEILREAQAALQESEAHFRAIFDEAGIGMSRVDTEGRIIATNRSLQDLLLYGADDLRGKTFGEITYPDDRGPNARAFDEALAGQRDSYQLEIRYVRKDGVVVWCHLTASVVRDAAGAPQFAIGMVEDINARKEVEKTLAQQTRALADALREAERADRAKSEFLSSMSHELRTPMTAVLGFAQLLESDPEEPLTPAQSDSVHHILKAGRHLLELINEVLDLARIESGRLSLSLESVPVAEVLEEALRIVEPLATQRGIAIHDQTGPHQRQTVLADQSRLTQVILNLLSNAIKYNRDGGTVTLTSAVTSGGYLSLSVRDSGHGISDADLEAIFEPFNRLGIEPQDVEGTGIGLSITKRLLELMNGTVEVESAVGEGSSFTIELPLADSQPMTSDAAPRPAAAALNANGSTRTLLYVEDNPATLTLVQRVLDRRPGIRLLSAPQAHVGIELARAHRPDVIVLDINLPGMDGYEALQWLRAHEETRHTPVIALSANAMNADVERGLAAGFERYLTKPINVADFLAAIDAVLAVQAREVITPEATGAEQRRHPRLMLNERQAAMVETQQLRPDGKQPRLLADMVVVDLSVRGAGLAGQGQLSVGTQIQLQLRVPGAPEPATARGIVMRAVPYEGAMGGEPRYQFGVEFDDVSDSLAQQLSAALWGARS